MRRVLLVALMFAGLCSCNNNSSRTSSEAALYYLKGSAHNDYQKKICIIVAGQSNIDGRNFYEDMPAYIKEEMPMNNTHYVKNSITDSFSPINITDKWAFDLVTYYHIAAFANEELYVIKWTQGGTSIDPQGDSDAHWTADYEKLGGGGTSLLVDFEKAIRSHKETDGEAFDIRAMLWHQGEGDRGDIGKGTEARYYNNLRNMIAYIRGVVGNARLPIITGTISHHSKQYDANIEKAQKRIASEDPYFFLIDMNGASLQDNFHFDAVSSEYFGKMAYDALIDAGVITTKKLNPQRPW